MSTNNRTSKKTQAATNDADNQDRVVFISGGSSGIGKATALKFASSGYSVALSGRDKQRIDEVIREMKDSSPLPNADNKFLAIQADFSDMKQVETLIDQVVRKFNRLDVLINNAGHLGQSLDLMDECFFQDFQSVLQVNLMAAARLTQLAAPHLIRSPRGVILNVSSVLDRVANPNLSYCVSKAGLSMLTKTLANELEGSKVRVVAIAPGPITTRISPLIDTLAETTSFGRMGTVDEVANVIRFLESEQASFVHGSTIDIDGGYLARLAISTNPYVPKSICVPKDD